MKIILVSPPQHQGQNFIREGRCMQATSSWGSLWMPLSLASIAAFLRETGNQVKLIDCQASEMSRAELIDAIREFNPSLAVVNTGFPSIRGDLKTVIVIKEHTPNIKTIAIGMYPTLLKGETLKECKSLDFAVIGEPEWVVSNLANAIENDSPLEAIQGLVFRDTEQIIKNSPQCFDENSIEELPFPARDLLNNDAYRHVADDKKFTHINIARGCPHSCSFCAAHYYYGRKFRKRSAGSIIAELKECVSKYGIKKFIFWSESFTLEREYGIQISDTIIENNLKITWYTRSRVDTLDIELLKKMKKAGCKGISIGIESPNNDILRTCKKHITVEQINNAIYMAKQVGVHVTGHFVFGLPGDDNESALESIRFARNSNLDFAQFYCAVPYPQTELWETATKNNWIESFDYSKYHLADSVMRNEKLSSKEIIRLRNRAFNTFYNRPRMLKNAALLAIKNKSFSPHLGFLEWSK